MRLRLSRRAIGPAKVNAVPFGFIEPGPVQFRKQNLGNGCVVVQGIILGQVSGQDFAAEKHSSPIWGVQPAKDAQQSGFSRAVGANDSQLVTTVHGEGNRFKKGAGADGFTQFLAVEQQCHKLYTGEWNGTDAIGTSIMMMRLLSNRKLEGRVQFPGGVFA